VIIRYPGYDLASAIISLKARLGDQFLFFAVFFYGVHTTEDAVAVGRVLGVCLGVVERSAKSLQRIERMSSTLEVATQNRRYTVVLLGDGQALISGHPEFCPEPVLVRISGSNWGGSMLKTQYLGRGMHMEYRHPRYRGPIVTSRIVDIQLRQAA
jgi:hypothetical protein